MDKKEISFRCNCGHSHYITFLYYPDESGMYLDVGLCLTGAYSFWRRFKDSFNYVFHKKGFYVDGVLLDEEQQKQLKEFINNL